MNNKKDSTINLMGMPVKVQQEDDAIEPNNDRVLMSDTLKDRYPQFDDDVVSEAASRFIMVVAHVVLNNAEETAYSGTLRSINTGGDVIELEMRCALEHGFSLVQRHVVNIPSFELHVGLEEVVAFRTKRGYGLKACQMFDIDMPRKMCVVLLQLTKLS